MKIGLISDTHDRLENIKKALDLLREEAVEMILHCGDWYSAVGVKFFIEYYQEINLKIPVKSIFGNNDNDIDEILKVNKKYDIPIEFTREVFLEINVEGRKIFVSHGDKVNLDSYIFYGNYDAVFYGHTHRAFINYHEKTLVVNPGSLSFVRKNDLTNERSLAIYDSSKNEVHFLTI